MVNSKFPIAVGVPVPVDVVACEAIDIVPIPDNRLAQSVSLAFDPPDSCPVILICPPALKKCLLAEPLLKVTLNVCKIVPFHCEVLVLEIADSIDACVSSHNCLSPSRLATSAR